MELPAREPGWEAATLSTREASGVRAQGAFHSDPEWQEAIRKLLEKAEFLDKRNFSPDKTWS
jgi:hypothetical protein